MQTRGLLGLRFRLAVFIVFEFVFVFASVLRLSDSLCMCTALEFARDAVGIGIELLRLLFVFAPVRS